MNLGTHPNSLFGYDIVTPIGVGAASTLYAVSKPGDGQLYVLKHVVIDAEHDERFIDQLKTEYEVGRKFKHPVLRRSIQMIDHRTLLTRRLTEAALLLELFDGEPIRMERFESFPSILRALTDVARALDALHGLGYVHCDLKPENILIGNHGEGVKVIDFGQTCVIGTVKRRIQGSAHYMAPEQVKCQPMMPRVDVFNFGATAYRVFTGRNIETEFTRPGFAGHAEHSPAPIEVEPRVPVALSKLIMQCLQPQPFQRPSMREVADAFAAVAQSDNRAAKGSRASGAARPGPRQA
jgi:serine/threonine-protein kinase